ncbi:hypothetical protein GPECTOR_6g874 [Gonium pectorale]|uniref:Sugar phosphate transporter domain-containing protein n=1 Tax=Gonium pectorale TaxID=33097 RepID=A0A150GVV5_GONPE|nr:hypothetical protein GPECTOR_6g874 [Gonium pectorale]|eukprot:KXZ53955.1 hypothetical protein GPECTOR_6g874 [Gonium pectorale]
MEFLGRKAVKTVVLILVWYVLSTGLSLFNKQLVGKDHGLFGKGAFPAPLLMSSVQFICQTLLAKLVFALGIVERTHSRRMPWSDYFRLVVPNGVTTGLDIGFSNKSLVFINLSFYTVCKSTVPVFLLFFAFIWGIEKPSMHLAAVVLVIVSGLVLLVRGETKFDLLGFGLVMTASCLSGLRFTLTQVLLHGHQSSAALGGPLEVLELLTPVMSITVLIFSLGWEELWDVLPGSPYFDGLEHILLTLLVVATGAVLAFLMVWTEYQVIKETSSLTFMIAGTIKEVVTVLAAVIVMGDELTFVNVMGLAIVIGGVLLFNHYKYKKLRQQVEPQYVALDTAGKDDEDAARQPRPYIGRKGHSEGGTDGADALSPVSAAAVAAASTGFSGPSAAAGQAHQGGARQRPAGLEMVPLVTPGVVGWQITPEAARTLQSGSGSGNSADIEDVVVGVGYAGDTPAVAVALSGAGISGPPRSWARPVRTRPGSESESLLPSGTDAQAPTR